VIILYIENLTRNVLVLELRIRYIGSSLVLRVFRATGRVQTVLSRLYLLVATFLFEKSIGKGLFCKDNLPYGGETNMDMQRAVIGVA